jgi:hypothetical protein
MRAPRPDARRDWSRQDHHAIPGRASAGRGLVAGLMRDLDLRGCQPLAEFARFCQAYGIHQASAGPVCWDTAAVESFSRT